MCKTKKAFFIDSNNRNADSASGTDFTIDLNHQLTVPDGSGIAVDSINLPSITTAPIVSGINNKLYGQLGMLLLGIVLMVIVAPTLSNLRFRHAGMNVQTELI